MIRLITNIHISLLCFFCSICLVTVASAENITGTIVKTMNSAGYTYVQLNQPEGNIWLAIPETELKKGDIASFQPGMEMKDFESKSMNRVFKSIIFSSGLANQKAKMMNPHASQNKTAKPAESPSDFNAALQAEQQNNTAAAPIEPQQPSPGSSGAVVPSAADIKVEKARGNNSFVIAECFEKAEELDNSPILIRGKVMKVSPMIMGRNWVHIQDGTGDPMKNTHDLVITTQGLPEKDTVVTFKGTLHANRDFGAGYKYAVIVEDAELQAK